MAKVNTALLSFNRGEVSKEALARVDLERMRLSAETQVNWLPKVIGPMTLRPGTEHLGSTKGNFAARIIPFVFGFGDTALIELTHLVMRVWVDDELISRPTVTSTITNGDFSSSAGWTLTTSSGAAATISSGVLSLAAVVRGGSAICTRSVTVSGANIGVQHGIAIVVSTGPVTFYAGTASGLDDYIARTSLDTGTHTLTLTPSADFYVALESSDAGQGETNLQAKGVDSITIAASGTMEITSPWSSSDLADLRWTQSGDVVYVACDGVKPYKIERRSGRGWGISVYAPNDGPLGGSSSDSTLLTLSAQAGNGTVTASKPLFLSTDVGRLIRIFTVGQYNEIKLGALNAQSSAIRVNGIGTDRVFTYTLAGTWVGTVTLQRSYDGDDIGFMDFESKTVNGTYTVDDAVEFDNVVVWYRAVFSAYTSGSVTVNFGGIPVTKGGVAGLCRITSRTSALLVDVEIMRPFSSTIASADFRLGDWSGTSGYPSSVAFYDGRLCWAGRDRFWASISDNYTGFDVETEGDSAPINRSVGFGPLQTINWLLPLTRLIAGRDMAETSIRSTSLDEPLTPSNFTLKDCSTQGSASLSAVKIDTRGVFVQQSGRKVYELSFNPNTVDYATRDLTRLNFDIGIPGFVDLAVQRQPDTFVHLVRDDGIVAPFLYDIDDQVEAWWQLETDGASGVVENVAVLPEALGDAVYYVVNRTIGGATKRYIEKLARQDQCSGLPEARLSDSHVVYSGTATTTITGLTHLEGETVVCWAWDDDDETGTDFSEGDEATPTYTVSGGSITIPTAKENACVGLAYTAQFKSAKLAYGAQMGSALGQKKKIDSLGLILANTHFQGLKYGQDFDHLSPLPLYEQGVETPDDTVWEDYDEPVTPLDGEWKSDSRLCLQAASPRPCTVMAAVVAVRTNES